MVIDGLHWLQPIWALILIIVLCLALVALDGPKRDD
jgi:hypothetical protein